MAWYSFLVESYGRVLAGFPPGLQWVVTLLILIGFAGAFVALIRKSLLFVILLVLFVPILLPVVAHFFTDLYRFLLFLIQTLAGSAPKA